MPLRFTSFTGFTKNIAGSLTSHTNRNSQSAVRMGLKFFVLPPRGLVQNVQPFAQVRKKTTLFPIYFKNRSVGPARVLNRDFRSADRRLLPVINIVLLTGRWLGIV